MKTILPGAAIGLLGGGENSLMLALAACRMGYRVHVCAPQAGPVADLAHVFVAAPYEDLDRVREFASSVDVVTLTGSEVPVLAIRAASGNGLVLPAASTFENIENGLASVRDTAADAPFLAEFLVIGARGAHGAFVSYPPISIDKTDGQSEIPLQTQFDTAQIAAAIRSRIAKQAAGLTRDMLEDLDFIGIASVAFRLTPQQELVAGDVIPHPHPAGQLTVDACVTSQYEQHLRAVCGLPLGSVSLLRPAAMANIPESAWQDGEPDWAAALAMPNVKVSRYGNRHGHLTATAASATLAKQIVRAARTALMRK